MQDEMQFLYLGEKSTPPHQILCAGLIFQETFHGLGF